MSERQLRVQARSIFRAALEASDPTEAVLRNVRVSGGRRQQVSPPGKQLGTDHALPIDDRQVLAGEDQRHRPVGVLQRQPPGGGRFGGVGRPQDRQARNRTQRG